MLKATKMLKNYVENANEKFLEFLVKMKNERENNYQQKENFKLI